MQLIAIPVRTGASARQPAPSRLCSLSLRCRYTCTRWLCSWPADLTRAPAISNLRQAPQREVVQLWSAAKP